MKDQLDLDLLVVVMAAAVVMVVDIVGVEVVEVLVTPSIKL